MSAVPASAVPASAGPVAVTPAPRPDPATRRLWLPHIRDIGVFGAFLAIFAMTLRPVVDNDVFWHLATGRFMWTSGRIPFADPFSWTAAGRPWIAHEWLTELWLYPLYTHGGYAALMLVFAAVITAAFVVTYATARRLGAPRAIAVPLTLLAAVASDHTWGVRPQMLSMLLMAVTLWLLVRDAALTPQPPLPNTGEGEPSSPHSRAQGESAGPGLPRQPGASPHGSGVRVSPWTLPPLLMLWANLHGGFIFGLGLITIFAAGDTCAALWSRLTTASGRPYRAFRLWPVAIASVLACLVNPNGLRGLLYPFAYLGDNASTRYIAEWVSPDFHQLQYQLFEALLLALIAGPLIAARLAPREHAAGGAQRGAVRGVGTLYSLPAVTQLVLILAFTYLALSSVRNINQFAVTVTPLIAAYLALSWRGLRDALVAPHRHAAPHIRPIPPTHAAPRARPTPRVSAPKGALNLALAATLAVAVLLVSAPALSDAHNVHAQAKRFPAGAAAYLRRYKPRGPLLNSYDWGGYLIWSLYPGVRVYVDGRPDMYGDPFMNAFIRTWQAQPGWPSTLRRQGVRLVLVEPGSGLGKALAASAGWRILYHDSISVLYERRGAR